MLSLPGKMQECIKFFYDTFDPQGVSLVDASYFGQMKRGMFQWFTRNRAIDRRGLLEA